jgi:hypothetical protein
MRKLCILLADDHKRVRDGLRREVGFADFAQTKPTSRKLLWNIGVVGLVARRSPHFGAGTVALAEIDDSLEVDELAGSTDEGAGGDFDIFFQEDPWWRAPRVQLRRGACGGGAIRLNAPIE